MSPGAAQWSVVDDRVESADGWVIGVDVTSGAARPPRGAALLVPATKHERDAWGPAMLAELVDRRFSVVRTDVRGRGESRVPHSFSPPPPGQLRRVVDDVAAAVGRSAALPGVTPGSIVLFGEQDTADAVARVAFADRRVGALVLVSPHLAASTVDRARRLPVCVLASKDDRAALAGAAELFRRADHPHGRFRLVGDVGSGTTMFAAWQYLRPGEAMLERWLATWAAASVG